MAARAAFRDENAAQEEGCQFVAFDVDDRAKRLEHVLGVALPVIADVIREDGEIVRDLGESANETAHVNASGLLHFN